MSETIEIVEYNPLWRNQFEELKGLLKEALVDNFISIDHIGSTSVEGLAAKDRIDVQITVQEINEHTKLEFDRLLLMAGFKSTNPSLPEGVLCMHSADHIPIGFKSDEAEWEKFFIGAVHPKLEFRSNIHVRKIGAKNQEYALLFRDFLRSSPTIAKHYEAVKIELAKYHANDRVAYCQIKDPVCDLIMAQALTWQAKQV